MKTTTISAAIARNPKGEILLVEQEAKYDSKPNWMLPGGRLEDGESIFESLRREFLEETGLELLTIDGLAYTTQILDLAKSSMFNVNVFEVTLKDGEINPNDPDGDIISAAYLSPDEATLKLKNNKFSYTKEPPADCIKNYPNNYKFWEYHWKDDDTFLVNKFR